MKIRALATLVVTLVVAGLLGTVPSAEAAGHSVEHGHVLSVPETPGGPPVEIHYSLFRPEAADTADVPLIFHSHGWGGSRTTSIESFEDFLDAGFGVLSFDQRSFGESGGTAHVQHPDYEGQDVQALVDLVADQDWVLLDDAATKDPRIGAIGGSYGGGYQFSGAFTSLSDRGVERFDALAPEIAWWDLKESLAPEAVPRSAWTAALYAAGLGNHSETVHKGFVYGAATGEWPASDEPGVQELGADLDAFFAPTGPKHHVETLGNRLDIPVLIGQGSNDNLFNLNQGLSNFDNALTQEARDESIFIGYHGGHALPNVLPPANFVSGDPCSAEITDGGEFGDLSLLFFRKHLKGEHVPELDGYENTYNLAAENGGCLSQLPSVENVTPHPAGTIVTPTGLGGPIHVTLTDGPVTVAGIPEVTADLTALGADARAFYALSVGASPATALVVQANMLPVHLHGSLPGERYPGHEIELPGVAVEVPAGQSLFLTVSGFSDMSFGHGSKTPGALLMENVQVHVPTL